MMNREEMIERVAKWWKWPTVPTQRLSREPGGWDWVVVDGMYVLTHSIHDPITRADWQDARNGVVKPTPASATRDEALLELAKWSEWPTCITVASALPNAPVGWYWVVVDDYQILMHSTHYPITYADWSSALDMSVVTDESTPAVAPVRLTAPDFLECGAQHMRDRAAQRDKPDGERSMARAVAAFNAQEGTNLTEEQGWRFMIQLKYSRSCAGVFVADDYEDMAAYAGLAGEAAQ